MKMNKQINYGKMSPGTGGGERTMKNSKLRMLITSAVSLLFVMLLGLGAQAGIDCNLTIPTSGGVVIRNTELNVTYNASDATSNVTVAFETRSTASVISAYYLTMNTSYVTIANVSNTSNRLHTNLTFGDRYHFGDGSYTFRATCYLNATGGAAGGEQNGVSSEVTATIDRSNPTCAFDSALVGSKTYAPTQQWSVTCANATSATLQFGSNSVKTMTKSTDSCTFKGDKSSVPQTSYALLTAAITDGYETTQCALQSIRIDAGVPLQEIAGIIAIQGSGGKAAGGQPTAANGSGSSNMVMLVIIVAAAYWFVRRKKGR